MNAYDCRPCGFRAEAHGDEESIAVRSCPRCGRRNTSAVARFFGVAVAWSLGAILASVAIAHHHDYRGDITVLVTIFALGVVVGVSLARTVKWRKVRSRVVFVQPPSRRRTTPESSEALTPQA